MGGFAVASAKWLKPPPKKPVDSSKAIASSIIVSESGDLLLLVFFLPQTRGEELSPDIQECASALPLSPANCGEKGRLHYRVR